MAKLNLGSAVQELKDPVLRSAVLSIQDAINNLGTHLAADPVGETSTPPPLQAVNVKTAGEMVHVTFTHNVPINKNIHYFLEYDNDPSFPNPHVTHNGTSRSIPPFTLPTKNDSSVTQNWYFRGYPQMPGSAPALPVNFGGEVPTPVTLSGTTALTLQPSTGSGTAAPDGSQGGYGFGRIQARPVLGPKRNIAI
jgi:hypothetical protein